MALMAYDDMECCVKEGVFPDSCLHKLRSLLHKVTVLKTTDPFAFNGIVMNKKIVVHKLKDKEFGKKLAELSGKKIVQVDVSQFELGGGAVACLVLPILDPRHV